MECETVSMCSIRNSCWIAYLNLSGNSSKHSHRYSSPLGLSMELRILAIVASPPCCLTWKPGLGLPGLSPHSPALLVSSPICALRNSFVPHPFFWLHRVPCRILVPQPGIEPAFSAVEAQSLNHWTTREVLVHFVGENECRILLRILEQLTIPFSRGSSQLRDQTRVSCIAGGLFTVWATRETHLTTAEFFELYQIISGLFLVKKKLLISFLQSSDCCWCLTLI